MNQAAAGYAPGYAPAKWVAAGVASLWVSVPVAVQALLVLMGIDYATGILCAALAGRLNAMEGFRGLARKVLTLLLVATAWYMAKKMGLGVDLGSAVAMAFAVNELISIVENCARAGVPIPETLLVVVLRAKRMAGRNRTAAEVEAELEKVGK